MTTSDHPDNRYFAVSRICERVLPGRKLVCSLEAGWSSLLVQTFDIPPSAEPFETIEVPDQRIVLVTKGELEIQSFSTRSWKKAVYIPGLGGMTAGGYSDRLRWHSSTTTSLETLHLYIPRPVFIELNEEFRSPGVTGALELPDSLCFSDPVISRVAMSLVEAIGMGAPDLYAQSAAQFLASHLLFARDRRSERNAKDAGKVKLPDRRMTRVLDFMGHHYRESLSLDQLAREAGISRYYFVQRFRQTFGLTPHRYLVKLRMNAASVMLSDPDFSIQEVAAACGYPDASHFAAAFHRHFSRTPTDYRRDLGRFTYV